MSILKVNTIQDKGGNTLLSSDGAGTISSGGAITNTPAFHVTMSADQIVSTSTDTKIQFDTEQFDTDNCYDNSTNYRFTPTVSGKYFVTLYIRSSGGDQTYIRPMVFKNGSSVIRHDHRKAMNTNENQGISGVVDLNGSTDYIEAYINSNSGTTIYSSSTDCYFIGYKLIGA